MCEKDTTLWELTDVFFLFAKLKQQKSNFTNFETNRIILNNTQILTLKIKFTFVPDFLSWNVENETFLHTCSFIFSKFKDHLSHSVSQFWNTAPPPHHPPEPPKIP